MFVYLVRCYGTPLVAPELKLLATQGPAVQLAAVQEWTARHIQRWCPGGACPWAEQVHWVPYQTGDGDRAWAAASSGENMGGEWLDHRITEMPVVPPAVPPRACRAQGQCTREVTGALHCCGPCAIAWSAMPRHEPERHSPGCDTRDALRRLLST